MAGHPKGQVVLRRPATAREGAAVVAVDGLVDVASVPYPLATRDDLEKTITLIGETGTRALAGRAAP